MKDNPWLKHLFHPLAIGVMVGCIALSVVDLVHLFVPAWNGTYLVAGCVLAALEANYSYRLLRARRLWSTDALKFRAVEIALFFILLKICSYFGDRWTDVLADVKTWPRYPLNVIDPETMTAFILAVLSWWASTQTVRDMERLSEPPERSRYYVPPKESLTNRFFTGGVILLLIAGVNRIGIAELLNLRRPSVPGLILNVLVYFLVGLVMLGQTQFTRLRNQWQAQKIKIADELAGRWVRYSLIFVGLATLVAFLLPTGYTVSLLDVAGGILLLIVGIFSFLLALLLWPLGLLLSLFGGSPYRIRRLKLPLSPLSLRTSTGTGATVGWFEVLRSLLFWAVAVGMIVYVIRSYLRDHPELAAQLAALKPIQVLLRLWAAIRRYLARLAGAVGERFPHRLWLHKASAESPTGPFRFFRLGALSPRERILYYYLSILRRAGQQGFPRQQAQTPYEYTATLDPHLPQAQEEMDVLTQAFVEARYSPHTIAPDWAGRVHAHWEQVKAALRALRDRARGNS
jgi:hypothetical protein